MFPVQDETRRPSRTPVVTLFIIAANVVVFLLELSGGDAFVTQWSAIPADIVAGRHLLTVLTSMFMHASWSHIIGNMIFLWAFGPEIEDAMGRLRYVAFYLLGGVVATYAQVLVDPASTVPGLGASGAIAAVMGAFLVTYPRDKIRTVLFFGWFFRVTFIPAALLIGLWFVIQLFSFGAVADVQSGGVAYAAHIGGIVFGAVAGRLFEDRAGSLEAETKTERTLFMEHGPTGHQLKYGDAISIAQLSIIITYAISSIIGPSACGLRQNLRGFRRTVRRSRSSHRSIGRHRRGARKMAPSRLKSLACVTNRSSRPRRPPLTSPLRSRLSRRSSPLRSGGGCGGRRRRRPP